MKVMHVVGARPNFIKLAPLFKEMKKFKQIKQVVVHTGQHYDLELSAEFFKDLNIEKSDYNLSVGSGTHGEQVGKIMVELEKIMEKEKPDLIIVVGDTNSTLAGAIPAKKARIALAHVEAGQRYFHWKEPEEVNRLIVDCLADFLFASSWDTVENLKLEGHTKKKVFLVGNIMIDNILNQLKIALKGKKLKELGLEKKNFVLLTMHRPSNVDVKEKFSELVEGLNEIQKKIKIVFPMHPRTKKSAEKFGLLKKMRKMKNLVLTEPIGFNDFLQLMYHCKLMITDSGGIQEETTALRIPCLLLETSCDRPITVWDGSNTLITPSKKRLIDETMKVLKGKGKKGKVPKYWDGKTSQRIVKILLKSFKNKKEWRKKCWGEMIDANLVNDWKAFVKKEKKLRGICCE